MADDRKLPPIPKRPPTHGDRNEDRRARTGPQQIPIMQVPPSFAPSDPPEAWEDGDQLTPPPQDEPDAIEVTAVRVEARSSAIRDRPGPTPAPAAVNAAITIHGVRNELHEFKSAVSKDLKNVDAKVDKVSGKVDQITGTVLAGMSAELDRRRDETHLMMRQKTEIGTASAIAEIDTEAARAKTAEIKKQSRATMISRLTIFLLAVATTVLGAIHLKGCAS